MLSDNISEKPHVTHAETLRCMQTAESVLLPIPRDAFEKLYLSPEMPTAGNLRRTFGNPTPIALIGFLVAATPSSMIAMGWRGAGGDSGAILPVYIFFGGLMQLLGATGEWIIGNTFSCTLFSTFGAFCLVDGTSLMPFFAVGTNYSPTGDTLEGIQTPGYHATLGLYYVTFTVLTCVFVICSIRTNICFFSALLLIVVTFGLIAGTHFQLALGHAALAAKLLVAAGACKFALCIPVWYVLIVQLLDAVDFPLTLPVGDLSTIVLGKSQKALEQQVEG